MEKNKDNIRRLSESNNSRYRIVDNTANETGNEYTEWIYIQEDFLPWITLKIKFSDPSIYPSGKESFEINHRTTRWSSHGWFTRHWAKETNYSWWFDGPFLTHGLVKMTYFVIGATQCVQVWKCTEWKTDIYTGRNKSTRVDPKFDYYGRPRIPITVPIDRIVQLTW